MYSTPKQVKCWLLLFVLSVPNSSPPPAHRTPRPQIKALFSVHVNDRLDVSAIQERNLPDDMGAMLHFFTSFSFSFLSLQISSCLKVKAYCALWYSKSLPSHFKTEPRVPKSSLVHPITQSRQAKKKQVRTYEAKQSQQSSCRSTRTVRSHRTTPSNNCQI